MLSVHRICELYILALEAPVLTRFSIRDRQGYLLWLLLLWCVWYSVWFSSNARNFSSCLKFVQINDTPKPTPARRGLESNSDSIQYYGTNETNRRVSRWPPITRINNKPYRLTRPDETIRRPQVAIRFESFRYVSFILFYRKCTIQFMGQVSYILFRN